MRKNKLNEAPILIEKERKLGDFYWAYADILRGIGIPTSTYDQRIMAIMAIKLLIDNNKLKFNFEYKDQFGLSNELYAKYKGEDTKQTFKNIIADIDKLGCNLKYFKQEEKYNPGASENILSYINHPKVFTIDAYIEELPNNYLEMVLDIYTYKANFADYPKERYKDLYEKTVARMKKLSGDLTGQHFTQKSIIHLMCEVALKQIKTNETIAIYDPTSGTGSMIMEAAHYFYDKVKGAKIEVYGQEYHAQTWILSKIFLEISSLDGKEQGIKNIIAFGNTLTNPAFNEGINGTDCFDFIIANPPFGVDWKHDYEKVIENMQSSTPNFLVVKEGKNIITPKKSDGQFLFMQHILNLMLLEKARGKRAIAAVISSSTLINTGSKKSSEAKLRNKIFEMGILKAVLEQPKAMFTNTDINTHIWFFDSETSTNIKVIKADNTHQALYSSHPYPQDKMKNAYANAEIKKIVTYINDKKEHKYVCKNVSVDNCYEINISNLVGQKQINNLQDIDALELEMHKILKELTLFESFV
jgi:type I restriction enzyme M protein